MDTTLEERVAALEMKMQQLTAATSSDQVWRDGWEATVGMSAHDAGFDEMVRLGAEYRRNLKSADDADSG